jgi:hypothetical protein
MTNPKLQTVVITIRDWDRYNAKRDQKSYTWLKLDNTWSMDFRLVGLEPAGRYFWIHLLCEASRSNSPSITVGIEATQLYTKIEPEKQIEYLHYLATCGMIKVLHAQLSECLTGLLGPVSCDFGPKMTDRVGLLEREREREKETTLSSGDDEVPDNALSLENPAGEGGERRGQSDPAHPLVRIWNEHCGILPKVRVLSGGRKRQAHARWRENPDSEYWTEIVKKLAASSWCTGRNDRGWFADFDFLVKPDTQARVMEGRYDDVRNLKPLAFSPYLQKTDEELNAEIEAKQRALLDQIAADLAEVKHA